METTLLRVRVSRPNGQPEPGATVRAALQKVGVSPADGYVDRASLSATASSDGVATLKLWPNTTGSTDAEYRIVARGAEGRTLLDEMVSVPESDVPVWLHDIVMTPPPSPKPYDEASIQAIQQSRILAQEARDTTQGLAQAVSLASDSVEQGRTEVAESVLLALGYEQDASQALQKIEAHKADIQQASGQVDGSLQDVQQLADSASDSANQASEAVDSATALYGSATALQDAEQGASTSAQQSEASRLKAAESRDIATQKAREARDSATQAGDHESRSSSFSDTSAIKAAIAVAAADGLRVARISAQDAAVEAAASRVSAAKSAGEVSVKSEAALIRSADLISHANSTYLSIEQAAQGAEASLAAALGIYGDAQALSSAVSEAQDHLQGAEAARVQAEQKASVATSRAGEAVEERIRARLAADDAESAAGRSGDDRDAVIRDRQSVGILHSNVARLSGETQIDRDAVETLRNQTAIDAAKSRDDVATTYANRVIVDAALSNNLIILRG